MAMVLAVPVDSSAWARFEPTAPAAPITATLSVVR